MRGLLPTVLLHFASAMRCRNNFYRPAMASVAFFYNTAHCPPVVSALQRALISFSSKCLSTSYSIAVTWVKGLDLGIRSPRYGGTVSG